MKITKAQLKQIIKEEISKALDQDYKEDPELRARSHEARKEKLLTAIKDSPKKRALFAAYKELFDKPDLSLADYEELFGEYTEEEPFYGPDPADTERLRQGLRRQERPRSPGDFRKDRWEV